MRRRCLRFGENGKRSGLAVAGFRQVELQLLVLPKLWAEPFRKTPRVAVCVQGAGGARRVIVSVVAAELQTVAASDLEELIRTNADLAILSSDEQLACIEEFHKCTEIVCGDPYDQSTRPSDGVEGWRRSSLVKIVESGHSDALCRISEGDFKREWESFVALRTRAVEAGSEDKYSRGLAQQLGRSSGQITRNGLLQLLLHVVFVETVRQRCGDIRPGYSRVRGVTGFVKGQLDCMRTAMLLAAGRSGCVCEFDQFSLDTPLNRILVAALKVVRAGWGFRLGGIGGELQQQAANVGRVFEAVPRISRYSALRSGRSIWAALGRLDREWREAVRLACLVLECASVDPGGATPDGVFNWRGKEQWSFVYELDTNVFWEALVRQFFGLTHRPGAKSAWLGLGNKKPADGFVDAGNIVLDAKYMEQPDTPDPAHQHQIFAYSHIYGAELALLVYGANAGEKSRWAKNGPWQRLGGRCFLDSMSLAFPSSEDVRNAAAWRRFVKKRRWQVSRRLHQVERRACRGRLQMLKRI